MDVNTFYGVLAGVSFTLLGLWWVACQARMGWLVDRVGRGMGYVVSMHFVIPGGISLISLVAPEAPILWRVTFAASGIAGIVGSGLSAATMRRRSADVAVAVVLQWLAVPLYAVVTVIALNPQLVGGLGLTGLQAEGIALVLLIMLGTQSAWLVTFAPTGE
jgi:hypothetical protein